MVHIADTKLRAGETYTLNDIPVQVRAVTSFTEGSNGKTNAWVSYYNACGGGEIVIPGGGVHIDSIEGEVARGSLDIVLYSKDDCDVTARTFSAKFKLRIVKDF